MFKHRKLLMGIVAGTFLFCLSTQDISWFQIDAVHAAQQVLDFQSSVQTILGGAMGIGITFMHFLIYICLLLIGMLLDPTFMDLSNPNQASMAQVLLKIWQISRNLTNIILAFLLIIGGIVTVVRAGDTLVKQYAVKFVVAVILVNFSWFFPRVIIDLSNVLTATIYSLPSAISMPPCKPFDLEGKEMPGKKCQFITEFSLGEQQTGQGWECPIPIADTLCVKYADLDDKANHPNAIIGGIVINYARLRYLHRVTANANSAPVAGATPVDRLPQMITILLQEAMVLLFSFFLLFPLVAMVVIFLVRIPVIWLTVAFMPFMFLGFVAGDLLKFWNPMEKIFNKFLKAAFLPTIVAIPFAIGFIMLNSAMSTPPPTGFGATLNSVTSKLPILPGVSNLWQLTWTAMAMLVIWYGAFMAMKFDEDMAKLIAPIESAGKNMGKFMFQLPLLVPLPLPGVAGAGAGGDVKKLSIKQLLAPIANPMAFAAPNGVLESPGDFMRRIAGGVSNNITASNKLVQTLNMPVNKNIVNNTNQLAEDLNAIDERNPANANALVIKTRELKEEIKRHLSTQGVNWDGTARDLQEVMQRIRRDLPALITRDLQAGKARD